MPVSQALAIEQVRARLAEETPGFYTDSQIRVWLNEGQREVARRALWKRESQMVPVIAGTQFYVAPIPTIQIYRVEYHPSTSTQIHTLEFRDINAMDTIWGAGQSQSQGQPSFYTLVASNPVSIELCPRPSVSGNLKVYFYAMPDDLLTTSNADAAVFLDVPSGWEDLPIDWATGLGFRKSRDVQAYQLAMASFNEHLHRLEEVAARYVEGPTYIEPAANWMYADYY